MFSRKWDDNSRVYGIRAESGFSRIGLFFFYFCFRCRAAIVGLVLVVVMLHWSGIANGKTLSSISISYYECQNCSAALQFTVLNCILNGHVFGGVEVSPGWNVKEGIRGGRACVFRKIYVISRFFQYHWQRTGLRRLSEKFYQFNQLSSYSFFAPAPATTGTATPRCA